MKTRLKQWFTTIPGIVLILAGAAFMILDVLEKVDFDLWHILSFFGVGMFLVFGHSTDFKAFGKSVVKTLKTRK